MKNQGIPQMRGFIFNSKEWYTLMENILPWKKKPVKDARDSKIKQLEHEILRKGLKRNYQRCLFSKKKRIFFGKKKEEELRLS